MERKGPGHEVSLSRGLPFLSFPGQHEVDSGKDPFLGLSPAINSMIGRKKRPRKR